MAYHFIMNSCKKSLSEMKYGSNYSRIERIVLSLDMLKIGTTEEMEQAHWKVKRKLLKRRFT